VIAALITNLVLIIKRSIRLDTTAAYLLLPYFAWIVLATLLNIEIWRLN